LWKTSSSPEKNTALNIVVANWLMPPPTAVVNWPLLMTPAST
jgi:hypothetical protein